MLCPFCSNEESKVLESRSASDKSSIRRRRECDNCKKRFTTYEKIEFNTIMVLKSNNTKQEFSGTKLFKSVYKTCKKCNIDKQEIEEFIRNLEMKFFANNIKEISTECLGREVLSFLKDKSKMAYFKYFSSFKGEESLDELRGIIYEITAK